MALDEELDDDGIDPDDEDLDDDAVVDGDDDDDESGDDADAGDEEDKSSSESVAAALPGDAELVDGDDPQTPPAGASAAPQPVNPIAALAQQFGLPPEEISRRLLGQVQQQPAAAIPATPPAEDDDEPITKGEARRLAAQERQRAIVEAERRMSDKVTDSDIKRMLEDELDRYSVSQKVIGKKPNEARNDYYALLDLELSKMPGWGGRSMDEARANVRLAAKRVIKRTLTAAGKLPAAKKDDDVQPVRAPGAVGKTKKREAEVEDEEDESEGEFSKDDLLDRRTAHQRQGIIQRMWRAGMKGRKTG